MKLIITIDLDNDAFRERQELTRIIQEVADWTKTHGFMGDHSLRDINGNIVGQFVIVKE